MYAIVRDSNSIIIKFNSHSGKEVSILLERTDKRSQTMNKVSMCLFTNDPPRNVTDTVFTDDDWIDTIDDPEDDDVIKALKWLKK